MDLSQIRPDASADPQPTDEDQKPDVKPEDVKQDDTKHEDEVQKEPEYEVPEITELDLEMVEARKKLNFTFRERQTHLPALNAYLRFFCRFLKQTLYSLSHSQSEQIQSEPVTRSVLISGSTLNCPNATVGSRSGTRGSCV